jgi:hypothetical protein
MKNFLYKTAFFIFKWCDDLGHGDLNLLVIFFLFFLTAVLNYYLGFWVNTVLFIFLWFIKKELSYVVLVLSLVFGGINWEQ